MHNVQELERKWIKYKIKSYILYIILSLLFVITIFTSILYYLSTLHVNNKNTTHVARDINKSINPKNSLTIKQTNVMKPVIPNDKLVLQPSLGFIDNVSNSVNTSYNDNLNSIPETKIEDLVEPKVKYNPAKTAVKEAPVPLLTTSKNNINTPIKEIQAKKIDIEVHSADDDLQDIIKRFKKTNNPTLGLFLAKRYYDTQKYDLAYNYALLTNQIDSKLDMSWIIFAKSLVKLGHKDMAIKTLKTYIKDSDSRQGAILLDEIESGRFK